MPKGKVQRKDFKVRIDEEVPEMEAFLKSQPKFVKTLLYVLFDPELLGHLISRLNNINSYTPDKKKFASSSFYSLFQGTSNFPIFSKKPIPRHLRTDKSNPIYFHILHPEYFLSFLIIIRNALSRLGESDISLLNTTMKALERSVSSIDLKAKIILYVLIYADEDILDKLYKTRELLRYPYDFQDKAEDYQDQLRLIIAELMSIKSIAEENLMNRTPNLGEDYQEP